MISYISPLSLSEFKLLVSIQFDNILDGFDNYINSNLTSTSSIPLEKDLDFINFIQRLFELNNNEVILDFFINRLSNDDFNNLRNLLSQEDKLILDSLSEYKNSNTVYFKITDKNLIPFFTRLSTHEIFFCTMYFNNLDITIWGNYNYTFPCFFNNEDNLNTTKKIASEYNLKL